MRKVLSLPVMPKCITRCGGLSKVILRIHKNHALGKSNRLLILPEVFPLAPSGDNLRRDQLRPVHRSSRPTFLPCSAFSTWAPVVPTFPKTFASSMAEALAIFCPTSFSLRKWVMRATRGQISTQWGGSIQSDFSLPSAISGIVNQTLYVCRIVMLRPVSAPSSHDATSHPRCTAATRGHVTC